MTGRTLFGTDGIRGRANKAPMTADMVLRVAQAAGLEFLQKNEHPLVVIGKDTRLSGYMVEPALTAGFISIGMDVVLLGPLPTPAVAMLTRSLRAVLGVMISASHNPYSDNGIKLFGPDGHKLSDHREHAIEKRIQDFSNDCLPDSIHLGRAKRLDDAPGRYIEFIKSTFPAGLRLNGLKIVIDCAHGAAYKIAPTILWELGAEIIPIGVNPDGKNINQGYGATAPAHMAQAVKDHKADIGLALDGDADRLVVADEKGRILYGDHIIGTIADWWHQQGRLRNNTVITTIMSNLGLKRSLEQKGIQVIQTGVGDRYVAESMHTHDANLGGEASGHIILSDYGTTGDGIAAALQILAIMKTTDKPISEITASFSVVPQITENFPCKGGKSLDMNSLNHHLKPYEDVLEASGGRLVIRKSGTEPLIRIMAEHDDETLLTTTMNKIKKVMKFYE